MENRKSQIFIFDLIFSIVILVVSLGIVFSYFTTTTQNTDIYDMNYQILSGFTQTKINSLNNEEIRQMFILGQIKNIKNTVAQQVAEDYYEGKFDLAKNLTRVFVNDYLNKQLSFRLSLYDEKTTTTKDLFVYNSKGILFNNSEISSVTQRTIFGFINKTNYYGPYIFKIEIWQ